MARATLVPLPAAYEVRVAPDATPTFEASHYRKQRGAAVRCHGAARQVAIAAMAAPAQPGDPLVLPAEATGASGVLVSLLAGTTQPKVAVDQGPTLGRRGDGDGGVTS